MGRGGIVRLCASTRAFDVDGATWSPRRHQPATDKSIVYRDPLAHPIVHVLGGSVLCCAVVWTSDTGFAAATCQQFAVVIQIGSQAFQLGCVHM